MYEWLSKTRSERVEYIRLAVKNPESPYRVWYKGKTLPRPTIQLRHEFLVYRIQNGRTQPAQLQLSAEGSVSEEFWMKLPDSAKLQETQHEILTEMIDAKGLKEYFTVEHQTKPLFVTVDGTVVNGNRRLCAFRELLSKNRSKHAHFENVEVAVLLEPGDDDDYDAVERHYQDIEDIDERFDWIQRTLKQRALRQRDPKKYTDERLAKDYQMRKTDVKDEAEMLEELDWYLSSTNQPARYELMRRDGNIEQALRTFVARKRRMKGTERKASFTNLARAILLESDNLKASGSGRIHDVINQTAQHIDDVLDEIVRPEHVTAHTFVATPSRIDPEHEWLEGQSSSSTKPVIADPGAMDPEARMNATEEVAKIITTVRDSAKRHQSRDALLRELSRIQGSLDSMVRKFDPNWNTVGLDQHIARIHELLDHMQRLMGRSD